MTPKQESKGEKTKMQSTSLKKTQNWGQNGFKKQSQLSSSWNAVKVYGVDTGFTLFMIFIYRIFIVIQDLSWLRHPSLLSLNQRVLEPETTTPFMTGGPSYSRLSTSSEATPGTHQLGVAQGVHPKSRRSLRGQGVEGSFRSPATKESDESCSKNLPRG